jgi:hypothetical protein
MVGGGRGIRTPGPRERTTVFKTAAFDHSAIPPGAKLAKFCILRFKWTIQKSFLENQRSSGLIVRFGRKMELKPDFD